jgi:outer membrane protein assembly factor BamB
MEHESAPPWERDPIGRWPTCIETDDGARVTIEKDTSDLDGWTAFLVVEDGSGTRYRRDTRATSSMAVTTDGGVVLVHVEDAVSRYAPTGALLWKTAHPRCGAPTVSVGGDGRVVFACGYSLVAMSPDGRLQWQKWPFGNHSVGQPLLLADGTMIVRSGATVARLDANAEPIWKVDTGWNRYVFPLGALPDGNLVFRTAQAEAHTPGDVHIYYDHEPAELFVITRAGEIVSRRVLEGSEMTLPHALPITPGLRSGRLP